MTHRERSFPNVNFQKLHQSLKIFKCIGKKSSSFNLKLWFWLHKLNSEVSIWAWLNLRLSHLIVLKKICVIQTYKRSFLKIRSFWTFTGYESGVIFTPWILIRQTCNLTSEIWYPLSSQGLPLGVNRPKNYFL